MTYDAGFFDTWAGGSASSAQAVVPRINALLNPLGPPLHPMTVLDVGCGIGTWASHWPGSVGVDGDYVRRNQLRIPRENFVAHDLRTPLDLGRRFDLALCLEVGEHLPAKAAPTLVESLCRHSDVVVFSAAVPGQGGEDHINERWPSWWAKRFVAHGYKAYDLLRDDMWWDQRVEWWYRQNTVVFASAEAAQRRGWKQLDRSLDLAQPALLMPELQPRLKATVCIPWRPSPSRMAAYARIREYWELFGWPVVVADSDTEVFSLAQARNNAVKQAKTEIVVISDADTIPMPVNVLAAVSDPTGICWPFTNYRILAGEHVDVPLSELHGLPYINTWDGDGVAGVGGCLICTKKEFWRLGGQPAEFLGWGWEDTAFTMVVRTLSNAKRLRGHLFSFEHNTEAGGYVDAKADSPGWDRNVNRNHLLVKPYVQADGRPWLMRALLKQRAAEHAAGVSPVPV